MTKQEFRAMNRSGRRHITIKYDDEAEGDVVVELWDGGAMSTKIVADTLDEAKDIARDWIDGAIQQ